MIRARLISFILFLGLASASVNARALEIVTLCDSITQGFQRNGAGQIFGITSPVNGAANIGGYQPRLNQLLDTNIEASNVYNWGIGGENSAQTVNRINAVLNARPTEYVLILCGSNDLYQGLSSSATSANVGTMIDRTRAAGAVPIISEITPNIFDAGGAYDNFIANIYNPDLKTMAAGRDATIILTFFEMRALWESQYNSGDGLHLSNAGYVKLADLWFETIRDVHNSSSQDVPAINLLLLD